MTRAELEAAAAEKYPSDYWDSPARAAYIQGRLDQAEADARIAEAYSEDAQGYRDFQTDYPESRNGMQWHGMHHGAADVAIRIRKGVE